MHVTQLLEPSCRPVKHQACIWVQFQGMVAHNTSGLQTPPQMIMDFVYIPQYHNRTELMKLPVHRAAFITLTDMTQVCSGLSISITGTGIGIGNGVASTDWARGGPSSSPSTT